MSQTILSGVPALYFRLLFRKRHQGVVVERHAVARPLDATAGGWPDPAHPMTVCGVIAYVFRKFRPYVSEDFEDHSIRRKYSHESVWRPVRFGSKVKPAVCGKDGTLISVVSCYQYSRVRQRSAIHT